MYQLYIYIYIDIDIDIDIDVPSVCSQLWVLGMGYGEVWILTSHRRVNLIFSGMYLDVGVIIE